MTKRDKASLHALGIRAPSAPVVAHVPQMYSLYELYFAAALARRRLLPAATPFRSGSCTSTASSTDSHWATRPCDACRATRPKSGTTGSRASAKRRSTRAIVCSHYSGARTTYKVDVTRLSDQPSVQDDRRAIRRARGEEWPRHAIEREGHGAREPRRGDAHRRLRPAARTRAAAARRRRPVRLRVAHGSERSDAVHDVGADYARRTSPCRQGPTRSGPFRERRARS